MGTTKSFGSGSLRTKVYTGKNGFTSTFVKVAGKFKRMGGTSKKTSTRKKK